MARARAAGAYLCLLIVFAAISSSSCSYQVQDLKDDIMHNCKHNIAKNIGQPWKPKHGGPCCVKVREANVADICAEFTQEEKEKIELWKWAIVAKKCGNALATGSNCAGYIVPAPEPEPQHQ
ncbi:uncharacterized protein LOC133927969 [Phragmites australis]|uniref:uncharacterized protein LOC133927969 n=1 Tax=Phragmites australis TaxID=29695 RepID=UPI002D7959C6|nr:uncharacterized protein LOC133927969 [Phragmites australis]